MLYAEQWGWISVYCIVCSKVRYLKGEEGRRGEGRAGEGRLSCNGRLQKWKFALGKPPIALRNGEEKGNQVQMFAVKIGLLVKKIVNNSIELKIS